MISGPGNIGKGSWLLTVDEEKKGALLHAVVSVGDVTLYFKVKLLVVDSNGKEFFCEGGTINLADIVQRRGVSRGREVGHVGSNLFAGEGNTALVNRIAGHDIQDSGVLLRGVLQGLLSGHNIVEEVLHSDLRPIVPGTGFWVRGNPGSGWCELAVLVHSPARDDENNWMMRDSALRGSLGWKRTCRHRTNQRSWW